MKARWPGVSAMLAIARQGIRLFAVFIFVFAPTGAVSFRGNQRQRIRAEAAARQAAEASADVPGIAQTLKSAGNALLDAALWHLGSDAAVGNSMPSSLIETAPESLPIVKVDKTATGTEALRDVLSAFRSIPDDAPDASRGLEFAQESTDIALGTMASNNETAGSLLSGGTDLMAQTIPTEAMAARTAGEFSLRELDAGEVHEALEDPVPRPSASIEDQSGGLDDTHAGKTRGNVGHHALAVAFLVSAIVSVVVILLFAGALALMKGDAMRKTRQLHCMQDDQTLLSLKAVVAARRDALQTMIDMAISNADSLETKDKVSVSLFNEFMERILSCTKDGLTGHEAISVLESALDGKDKLSKKAPPEAILAARRRLIQDIIDSAMVHAGDGCIQECLLTTLVSCCATRIHDLVEQGLVQPEVTEKLRSATDSDGQLAVRMQILLQIPEPSCCNVDSCCAPIAEVLGA